MSWLPSGRVTPPPGPGCLRGLSVSSPGPPDPPQPPVTAFRVLDLLSRPHFPEPWRQGALRGGRPGRLSPLPRGPQTFLPHFLTAFSCQIMTEDEKEKKTSKNAKELDVCFVSFGQQNAFYEPKKDAQPLGAHRAARTTPPVLPAWGPERRV